MTRTAVSRTLMRRDGSRIPGAKRGPTLSALEKVESNVPAPPRSFIVLVSRRPFETARLPEPRQGRVARWSHHPWGDRGVLGLGWSFQRSNGAERPSDSRIR